MLMQRVVTSLVAVTVLLLVLFVAPAPVAEAAIALVALTGAWEWARFVGLVGFGPRLFYVALVAALLGAAFIVGDPLRAPVLLLALVWWIAALFWVFAWPTPVPTAVAWLGGLCVLIPLFVALTTLYRAGPEVMLFVLFVVWAADVGAFFAGRTFGRVKLSPQISPGKTWEGVFGGLVMVAVVGAAGARYFDIPVMALVPFCIAAAGLSIVGDLTVSIFKRNAGIKDSGSLFPGHGGILDRIDSIAAATPVFALGLTWTALL